MIDKVDMEFNHLMYIISLEKYLDDSEVSGEPLSSVLNTVKTVVRTRREILEAMREVEKLTKFEIN